MDGFFQGEIIMSDVNINRGFVSFAFLLKFTGNYPKFSNLWIFTFDPSFLGTFDVGEMFFVEIRSRIPRLRRNLKGFVHVRP